MRQRLFVSPFQSVRPFWPAPPQYDSSPSCAVSAYNQKSCRSISKVARNRNAKRTAGKHYLPPYLAAPAYSIRGQELVDNFTNYTLFDHVDDVNEWATQALHRLQDMAVDDNPKSNVFTSYLGRHEASPLSTAQQPLFVGLDVGWNFHMNAKMRAPTHMLHVSLPSRLLTDPTSTTNQTEPTRLSTVASLHLTNEGGLNVQNADDFPRELRLLLEHPSILACGVQINRDLARLSRKLHIHVDQRLELDQWHFETEELYKDEQEVDLDDVRQTHSNHLLPKPPIDMTYLCRRYLQVELEPTIGTSSAVDYSLDPLPTQLIQYGALQALHSRRIAEAMYQRYGKSTASVGTDSTTASNPGATEAGDDIDTLPRKSKINAKQHEQGLYVGQHVYVYFDGVMPVAEGVIEFLGGRQGVARTWGNLIVNRGKALVRLTTLHQALAIPTFNSHTAHVHVPQGQPMPWDGKVRLQDIFYSQLPVVAATAVNLQPNGNSVKAGWVAP